MLDKLSGRILHIDFGDCFEIAMVRDKYPERIPFRLTRMLIKAMEVSGIEGSYRSTCERTMSVLRSNRDSLVAMLEAFVHDPLISWRLVDLSRGSDTSLNGSDNIDGLSLEGDVDSGVSFRREETDFESVGRVSTPANIVDSTTNGIQEELDEMKEYEEADDRDTVASMASVQSTSRQDNMQHQAEQQRARSASRARSLQMHSSMQTMAAKTRADARIASITAGIEESVEQQEASLARSRIERSMKQRELLKVLGGKEGIAHENALNRKALKVIRRVQDKLNGTDFADCEDDPLDVSDQVQRLIVQATSSENLCQLFIGWCAFW